MEREPQPSRIDDIEGILQDGVDAGVDLSQDAVAAVEGELWEYLVEWYPLDVAQKMLEDWRTEYKISHS